MICQLLDEKEASSPLKAALNQNKRGNWVLYNNKSEMFTRSFKNQIRLKAHTVPGRSLVPLMWVLVSYYNIALPSNATRSWAISAYSSTYWISQSS